METKTQSRKKKGTEHRLKCGVVLANLDLSSVLPLTVCGLWAVSVSLSACSSAESWGCSYCGCNCCVQCVLPLPWSSCAIGTVLRGSICLLFLKSEQEPGTEHQSGCLWWCGEERGVKSWVKGVESLSTSCAGERLDGSCSPHTASCGVRVRVRDTRVILSLSGAFDPTPL